MSLRYPGSIWHPLPEAERQPLIVPTQGILHTVVGHGNPYGTFDSPGNGDESHEWLPFTGPGDQYVSLDRSADANFHANRRPDGTGAWSIETQDNGPATVQDTPWSGDQCNGIVERMVWGNDPEGLVAAFQSLHGVTIDPIPLVVCPDPDAPGWGYHSLWINLPGGNPWTKYQGKTCPGRARIAQFPELLARARDLRSIAHAGSAPFLPPTSQEDDMPPEHVMTPPPGSGKSAYVARYPDGRAVHIGGGEDAAFASVPHLPCADVGEYERLLEQSGTSYRD